MKTIFLLAVLTTGMAINLTGQTKQYINNRAPLKPNPYIELPLGAIKAEGWLKEMLLRQKSGSTGNLDKLYPLVMGDRNGWLGGDGDQWERGPYWIDGLLPLAYILNDQELIAKSKRWVEWAIKSQQPDGYFGPSKDYGPEPGIQRDNSRDWWPKMVMLKILKQYYTATNDERVIQLLTNYFKYQLKELPKNPLDHWTFWGRYRGPDNLMVVYWLYNITGEKFLLQLADLIHKQTFDYTNNFLHTDLLTRPGSIHCVNLAQGIKGPLIYYQHHPEKKYVDATEKGFKDIRKFNGLVHGLYGGDEGLHGNEPTQGSEFCSAVELMFSLESILPITGNVQYADHLERIAFNALPTQATDDFMNRQYFQQANQVMATRHKRNFDTDHSGTDLCFGLLTGYACCTSNMHQGWPKFTQNLWYATADNGIAALVYAPSEVKAFVAGGKTVTIKEETGYPFNETISFTMSIDKDQPAISFPFHLRIPQWCTHGASVKINGVEQSQYKAGQIVKLNRAWKSGDKIELRLPMHVFKTNWVENSMAIERGPLVYALKMEEEWKEIKNDRDPVEYGASYYEVRSNTPWNFAVLDVNTERMQETYRVSKTKEQLPSYPWNLQNAPIEIKTKGIRVPWWGIYNEMSGPIPYSHVHDLPQNAVQEEITLVPYGCTTLRVAQFPAVRR